MNFNLQFNETNQQVSPEFKDVSYFSSGAGGKDCIGIQSVEQTATSTEDGGANIITVTKTDGTTSAFTVHNGNRGAVGPAGVDGKDGVDGYTPVKGKDYFTETDKAEMVSAVIAALPVYDGSVTAV